MSTWIALFRGINVGGHNKLPMAELSRVLEDIGLVDVRTVIQSGNVVFRSTRKSAPALARDIEAAVEKARGFRPAVLVLDSAGFVERLDANPFPEGTGDPKTLHLFFTASKPTAPDLAAIEGDCSPTERWKLDGDVFYLHAPDGIGRSKLAGSVEKRLGVPGTARNWRTLGRLRDLTAKK